MGRGIEFGCIEEVSVKQHQTSGKYLRKLSAGLQDLESPAPPPGAWGDRRSRVTFPLTLALSLREREQRHVVFDFSNAPLANPAARILVRRNAILPLPKGEGRGEGEQDTVG
jgi:hypothetical protein